MPLQRYVKLVSCATYILSYSPVSGNTLNVPYSRTSST
nr:MAG TPA: hypothetical protein [Caudoviricetes sp.]